MLLVSDVVDEDIHADDGSVLVHVVKTKERRITTGIVLALGERVGDPPDAIIERRAAKGLPPLPKTLDFGPGDRALWQWDPSDGPSLPWHEIDPALIGSTRVAGKVYLVHECAIMGVESAEEG